MQLSMKTTALVAFALGVFVALWFGRKRWEAMKGTLEETIETMREDPRVHDAMPAAGDFASTAYRDAEQQIRRAAKDAADAVKDKADSVRTQVENRND